ncbi:hypothetical protein [Streptomyces sp. DH12]|nr:hypothetical protein [Streptomyces sp. DH12]
MTTLLLLVTPLVLALALVAVPTHTARHRKPGSTALRASGRPRSLARHR